MSQYLKNTNANLKFISIKKNQSRLQCHCKLTQCRLCTPATFTSFRKEKLLFKQKQLLSSARPSWCSLTQVFGWRWVCIVVSRLFAWGSWCCYSFCGGGSRQVEKGGGVVKVEWDRYPEAKLFFFVLHFIPWNGLLYLLCSCEYMPICSSMLVVTPGACSAVGMFSTTEILPQLPHPPPKTNKGQAKFQKQLGMQRSIRSWTWWSFHALCYKSKFNFSAF